MNEPSKRQNSGARHEAIDAGDFVYAATGARVRRLTMPDGSHWFRRWTCARSWDTPRPERLFSITSRTTSRQSRDCDWKSKSQRSRR